MCVFPTHSPTNRRHRTELIEVFASFRDIDEIWERVQQFGLVSETEIDRITDRLARG